MKKESQNNIKLSIIVPNYNSEKYLSRNIESLINQTYKNIEIIVVDDGSLNSCESIVNEYIKKDKRIKYVTHKKNEGLFHARLAGADIATGDYIAFLDADDYVSMDYYRTMVSQAYKSKSDIVIGNTILEFNGSEKYEYPLSKVHFKELNNSEIMDEFFYQRGYNYIWYTIWNKIYSSNIWNKARKHYDKIKEKLIMTEDIAFSTVLFYYAKKLTKVENDAIFYCKNSDSSTSISNMTKEKETRNINDLITSFNFIEEFIKEVKVYDKYKDYFEEWKSNFATGHKETINNISDITEQEKEELIHKLEKYSNKFQKKSTIDYLFKTRTPWDSRLEETKKIISDEKIKYVSFDIFDTLIIRPFFYPTDLFQFLDEYFIKISNENSINFSKMRIESESYAREIMRKTNPLFEDITLDEIYDAMYDIYGVNKDILNKMKEKEVETELKFCKRRNTAYELYELATFLGKKVICVSDMYLDEKIIRKMLEKNGYDIKDIYVSSKIKKTKATGTLYEYVINKIKCNPEEIVHIGDNYNSDYLNAKKNNLESVHFPKPIDCLYSSNNLIKMFTQSLPFWQDNRESMRYIGVRVMLAMVANKYFDNPFRSFNYNTDFNADPYLIGYYALGSYNYAITKWLLDNTNGVNDKIAFMARDGYLSMETYEMLKKFYNKPAESIYMYVSRKSLVPILISDKFDFFKLTDLLYFANNNPKKVLKFLKNVMVIDEEKIKKICEKENISFNDNFKSIKDFNVYLKLLADNFFDEEKHKKTREKLKKYFDNILGERTAIFDVGYSGRPEYYLTNFCKKKIDIYFLNTNCDECQQYSRLGNLELKTFFPFKPVLTGNEYELLLSKISPSCIGYDTEKDNVEPIFENFKDIYNVNSILDTMQKSAIEFTRDMCDTFGEDIKRLYYHDYSYALPIMAYFNSPEQLDRDILSAVIFEDDIGYGIDRKMVDDMASEAKSKNQLKLNELLNINDIKYQANVQQVHVQEEINNDGLNYNKIDLSKKNKVSRLVYYTLFDRMTLKRRIKEIGKGIIKK